MLRVNIFDVADNPTLVFPVNCNEGFAALPAGSTNGAAHGVASAKTFSDALPVTSPTKSAVITFAIKLPKESYATMESGVLKLVAVVAELIPCPAFGLLPI